MDIKEISDFELLLNKTNLEFLRKQSLSEITESNVSLITKQLDQLFLYFIYCKDQASFEKLFRTTINKNIVNNNVRLQNISNLKYPPLTCNLKKYGRCNLPNQSVLYASLMGMTALDEMKPKVGDLITETIWRRKSYRKITYVPIFSNQPTTPPMMNMETREVIPHLTNFRTLKMNERFLNLINSEPKNVKELSLLVTQFIADFFSKRINSENHFN